MALEVIGLGASWVGRVDDWNAVDCFEDIVRRSLSVGKGGKVGPNVSALWGRKKKSENEVGQQSTKACFHHDVSCADRSGFLTPRRMRR